MMLKCPHCAYQHDISARIAGDRIFCTFCNHWLMLAFHARDGAAYFVKVSPPVSYPREKR